MTANRSPSANGDEDPQPNTGLRCQQQQTAPSPGQRRDVRTPAVTAEGVEDRRAARATDELYALALNGSEVWLRDCAGTMRPLEPSRWLSDARGADLSMLLEVHGPVLDVGCGPGRFLVALRRRGTPALGIDVAPSAIRLTERAGVLALQRSVFGPVPGAGHWATVLLADGNVGIGGDPIRLLRRAKQLLRPGGRVVLELAPPGGQSRRSHLRLEARGRHGAWFPWSYVTEDEIDALCDEAGLVVDRRWQAAERDGGWPRTRCFATATG